jgi:sialic acid synthase SpsE/mannose-6-phosphate isomerase-like protein (cupin superfamily)
MRLKDEIDKLGFISICTPFDESSVDLIEKHGFDIIKIASCSFTDWPLLERVVQTELPIIASAGGASLEDIDKIVSFFEHRRKNFSLMHCVAEYPARDENLQMNQIDLFRKRYPKLCIGYSSHDDPDNIDSVRVAIAKGAVIFERHVGVATSDIVLNDYSADPKQIRKWLETAQRTFEICGVIDKRSDFTNEEKITLRALHRGVFAKRKLEKGERITLSNTFCAIPAIDGQIIANDMSKYTEFYAECEISRNQPILLSNTKRIDIRVKVYDIVRQVKDVLRKSKVIVPGMADLEISHHYGVDLFNKFGSTTITVVNREYCKRLIILLPGQKHPEQYHKLKDETFNILYGDVFITLNGIEKKCKAGDIVTVEKGIKHSFYSIGGAVIEELSSTYYRNDSYYIDSEIANNKFRKTLLTYWMD